ncbi:hypothetical protein RB595_002576 [Gaeumannomyces hyphopodioides]
MEVQHHQLPTTKAAADDDCKQPTMADNAGEKDDDDRSVRSSTKSPGSSPLSIEFTPTVRKRMTFVEYESQSDEDDRSGKPGPSTARFASARRGGTAPRAARNDISTLPSRMTGEAQDSTALLRGLTAAYRRESTHGSGSDSSECSSGSSRCYPQPSRNPIFGPSSPRTEPQDGASIMAELRGAIEASAGMFVGRERTAILDAVKKLEAFAEEQQDKNASLLQRLEDSKAKLVKSEQRAAEICKQEASLRQQFALLERERGGYMASASDLRDELNEANRQVEFFRMQNLGAEAFESARLEAEATEKLKVSEAQNEEMQTEIERLSRELQETKMDLDTAKSQGMLSSPWSSSSPDLPSANQVMAENKKLKETVDTLSKDLAQVQKAHDKFLDDVGRESLNSGSDGNSRRPSDSSDDLSFKLSLIHDRVSQLDGARRDVVLRLAYTQAEVNRAVRGGDAAMEKQQRDEERKLSVLAEIQKATLDECASLQQQLDDDQECLGNLESQASDLRAGLARMPRDSNAFKAAEQAIADAQSDVKLCEIRSLQRVQAMEQLLDEAGSKTHIDLKTAQQYVKDLRALNDMLERENVELKKRAARNDPLAQRFEESQQELEARGQELEEQHLEQRQTLEVQYHEREVRLKKCQEELLRLREELDGVRTAFDDTTLQLHRREEEQDGTLNRQAPEREDVADARAREVRDATRRAVSAEFRDRVSKLGAVNDALTTLLGDSNHRAASLAEPLSTHEQEYRELARHVEPRGAEDFLDLMRRRADILDGRGAAGPLTVSEGQLAATWLELLRAKVLFGHKYRARLWKTTTTGGGQDSPVWDPFVEVDALVRRFESVYEVIPGLPRTGLAGLRLLRAQVALDYLGGDAEQTAAAFKALGLKADGGADRGHEQDAEWQDCGGIANNHRTGGPRLPSSDAAVLRATPGWATRVERLEERRRRWKAGDKPAAQEPRGPCGCRLRTAPCAEHASRGRDSK